MTGTPRKRSGLEPEPKSAQDGRAQLVADGDEGRRRHHAITDLNASAEAGVERKRLVSAEGRR
jgi:hypothetical protein